MEQRDAEKKAEMPELDLWGSGQNPRGHRTKSASKPTVATGTKTAAGEATMEAVVARESWQPFELLPEYHHYHQPP